MFGLKFSKLPRHRQFSYTPVYYDEETEKLDDRVKSVKRELGETETTSKDIEDSIRKAYQQKQFSQRYSPGAGQKFYGLKILAIAGFLSFIFYKVLKSDLIESLYIYFDN